VTEAIMRPFGKKSRDWILTPPELDKRYTVLQGAVRSAKTFSVTAKLIVQYSRYEVGGKRIICGTSKATVRRNILLDLEQIVGRQHFAYNQSNGELTLFDKTYFIIASRDESSYKTLLGSTVGLAIVDEAVEAPKSFFAQLLMRMSPTGARLVATTNPGSPYASFKADFLDAPAIQKDLTNLHFMLDDNPNIDVDTKASIVASQTGVYALRYIQGLWVLAEGSIWSSAWNENLNTCTNKTEPIWLKNAGGYTDRWYAIDAGVDHPQVTLEFYLSKDNVIYVTREDVWDSRARMQQRTDGQYADALEKFMGNRDHQVILPPEAASYREELSQRGFWVVAADNSVSDGIHTVSTLLHRRKVIINKDACPRLHKAIPAYSWDPKAAKLGDEAPLKQNDDEADALRYGLHGKLPSWFVTGA
jgi:PBSX family phage terminase large subunit